jgi:hypothetical protein
MDVFILGTYKTSHYTTQEEIYVQRPLAHAYEPRPSPRSMYNFSISTNQIFPVAIKPQYTAMYLAAGCTDQFSVTR